MVDHWTFALTVFTGFFGVMNPIANVPIFIGLVENSSSATKKRIALKSTFFAFLITASFILLGKLIFQLFGLTIPAFKITGGILIFFIGVEMLKSKKTSMHDNQIEVDEGIAVSPLAIPILAGPGTIVTAMNFVAGADYLKMGIVITMFALLCLLTYISFSMSQKIIEKLGQNIIRVVGKLMGLIIAIIGTNMVIEGIKMAFLE